MFLLSLNIFVKHFQSLPMMCKEAKTVNRNMDLRFGWEWDVNTLINGYRYIFIIMSKILLDSYLRQPGRNACRKRLMRSITSSPRLILELAATADDSLYLKPDLTLLFLLLLFFFFLFQYI